MAIKFFAKDVTYKTAKKIVKGKGKKNLFDLNKLTGIELRLLPPFIIDNNTKPVLLFPGLAKLYCLTIVVSDANNQVVGGIDLQGFPRIGDKEHLPINKTIFYWQKSDTDIKAPSQIHVMTSVIKSKKALREVGKIMTELKNDTDYKGIIQDIKGLASKTTPVGAALDIVTQLASVVGKYLGNVEDKPIGTIVQSYTALYGDFAKVGVNRKTYKTKKVNFDFELVVRDADIETKKAMVTAMEESKTEGGVKVDMIPVK